jgi:hypothetical protein
VDYTAECVISQSWRLEVLGQGANSLGFLWGLWGRICSEFLSLPYRWHSPCVSSLSSLDVCVHDQFFPFHMSYSPPQWPHLN